METVLSSTLIFGAMDLNQMRDFFASLCGSSKKRRIVNLYTYVQCFFLYKTIYVFIRKKGQGFVYICTPHQVKKNYRLKEQKEPVYIYICIMRIFMCHSSKIKSPSGQCLTLTAPLHWREMEDIWRTLLSHLSVKSLFVMTFFEVKLLP